MGTIVQEGAWDCSSETCGETRIPGFQTACPKCGDPRDPINTPSERPYYVAEAPEIKDADVLEMANAGPSWQCKCGQLNRGDAKVCAYCNKEIGSDAVFDRTITYDDGAGTFSTIPSQYDDMVEESVAKAERIIAGGKPRKLRNLVLPMSKLRTIGEKTLEQEAERDEVDRQVKERIRISNLPQFLQMFHLLWQLICHWCQPLKPYRKPITFGAIGLTVAGVVWALIATFIWFTATVPGTVTVAERHWERGVEVEQYTTLTQEDWSYPSDARVNGNETRVRSYRTVHDGWHNEPFTDYKTEYRPVPYTYPCNIRRVDNGNGSFTTTSETCNGTRQEPTRVPFQNTRQVEDTHQEPVYDTWYFYEIDRWVHERWVTASDATSPQQVMWPEVTDLRQDNRPGVQIGEERVAGGNGGRRETYTVVYTDSQSKRHTDKIDQGVWNKTEVGKTIVASYYKRNGELSSVDWNSVLSPAASLLPALADLFS
jgi:hypothetical protein